MSNDQSTIDPDVSSAQAGDSEGSRAPLVVLAGSDDTLCIDDMCVPRDIRATDPAIAEVTA